jgi:hypothetical protein
MLKKANACRVIMRALRKSRAPIVHLKKDKDILANLQSPKFEFAIQRAHHALKIDSHHHPLRDREVSYAVINLQQARSEYQTSCVTPVFTPIAPGLIPRCELREPSPHLNKGMHVTRELDKSTPYFPTMKDLDALVRHLSSRSDIFPWAHTEDGCYARAQLIVQFLIQMGVPEESISKIYLMVPQHKFNWRYHVAVIVNGMVIDPGYNPNNTIPAKNWIGMQKAKSEPLIDLGIRNEAYFSYEPRECTVFTTQHDMSMGVNEYQGRINLKPEDDSIIDLNVRTLAKYRSKLDDQFFGKLFFRYLHEERI